VVCSGIMGLSTQPLRVCHMSLKNPALAL